MARWECTICGYIYDEEGGDPDNGIAPGTRFDDLPDGGSAPSAGLRRMSSRRWFE